jgi:hypothetical protein
MKKTKEQIIITKLAVKKHNIGSGNPIQAVAW